MALGAAVACRAARRLSRRRRRGAGALHDSARGAVEPAQARFWWWRKRRRGRARWRWWFGGEVKASAPLDVGENMRLAVGLGEATEQKAELVFLSGDEERLAALPFAIHRGDVRPRASALSRPAVVAKDIALEVLKAGRRDRRVLLPRGTGLPMKAEQVFLHRRSERDGRAALVARADPDQDPRHRGAERAAGGQQGHAQRALRRGRCASRRARRWPVRSSGPRWSRPKRRASIRAATWKACSSPPRR